MSPFMSVIVAISGCALLFVSRSQSVGHSSYIVTNLLREDSVSNRLHTNHGLFNDAPARTSRRAPAWLCGSIACVMIELIFMRVSTVTVVVAAIIGVLASDLWLVRRAARAHKRRLRSLEFYLPIVLERVVMGVGSGLDIIPALREACSNASDPASHLMRGVVELSERGLAVETAFNTAATHTELTSVKHACVHLGLAHRQGGEIIRPLKELSDATQTAYQETVEEWIARLPVEAVLPLVVTFAGLIICFLTVPLMQVSAMTKTVIHEAR